MNRKDILPIAVAVAVMIAWTIVDRFVIAKKLPQPHVPGAAATNYVVTASTNAALVSATNAPPRAPVTEAAVETAALPEDTTAATFAELKNDRLILRMTSRGASVEQATLTQYPQTLKGGSGPVILSFTNQTALAYEGLAGLDSTRNFLLVEQDGGKAVWERPGTNGLVLRRTVQLTTNYYATVTDEFFNRGAEPIVLSSHTLRTGTMQVEPGHRNMIGYAVLGVDTLTGGADGVKHWGGDLAKWFGKIRTAEGSVRLPERIQTAPLDDSLRERSVDWIAAKNKYFVQILAPQGGADVGLVQATREIEPAERADANYAGPRDASISSVAGVLQFTAQPTIAPGQQFVRSIDYYVGPKKYESLVGLRRHQVDVMEFGYFRGVGKTLLWILNWLHAHLVPNYGIAIMLLTVIVRTVFWPLTHKSTMSMKRMTKLQPLMQQIREKHKANPQKMQMEIMAMYKEHKVNPLAGCLPMLIQIPVFIALFYVLRSAIELRYASFLWIRDLSEPERILDFGFAIPLLGWDTLNLLPVAMAGTMWLQMKLTPTAGDPQQQKIMMTIMPIMMLFMLYDYAAGLALYWTTTNVISIGQQFYYRRLSAKDA